MPEICFYEPWTYQLALPEKFEQILEETKKKRISYEADHCSQYNTRTQGKSAKLHPPTLSAVLKLIAMQEQKEPEAGAAGIQNVENSIRYFCMEYPLDEEVCVMTYNFRNGRFCGIRKKKDPDGGDTTKMPGVLKGGSTGEEYLAMLAFASIVSKSRYYDDEFHACYEELKRALKKGLEALVLKMSFLCCDNLYQRVTAGTKDAIPFDCNQFFNGKLKDSFLPFDLNSGIYAPNACIIGSFKVLGAQKGKNNATIAELKVAYKGCFTCPSAEEERIPMLPENYIASQEVEEILEMVTHTPARLFMMTGEAGTGKTTDARMLAQILELPYYVFTCGPGTDELELLASTVPNMGTKKGTLPQLPDFQDLQMDPASALYVLSGIYEDGISEGEAFHKLLSLAFEKGYESARKEKDFFLKESEIIKACRRPSVLEIQEPSMIEKPGTLTRLNSLFDDGAVTDLINGEKIRRDPNTIIIMTTNLDYVGCGNFNQSVLSRMSLIQPKQELTEEEMKQRITARTGYADENVLRFMISVVKKIHAYLKEEDLQDGVCGYRELENWVLTFQAIKDIRRAAQIAVLSKAAMDPEEQEHLMKTYIEPYYSKQE